MFANQNINNIGFVAAFFFFFHLDVTSEVKLKLSSLNLPSLSLALGRPCGINLFIHVLGTYHLGGKTSKQRPNSSKKKKRPRRLSECHEKLLVIVIMEVNIQIAKAIT